jgi:hypothetical protein
VILDVSAQLVAADDMTRRTSRALRLATFAALDNHFGGRERPPLPLRVTVTRLLGARQRALTDGSLQAASAALRKEVERFFGATGRGQERVRWRFAQARAVSGRPACLLTLQPLEPLELERERPERSGGFRR